MPQDIIDGPPLRAAVDEQDANGRITGVARPWAAWIQKVFFVVFAEAQSGTTAQRPTENLWPGRPYMDVSLGAHGKKIFVDKDSTGWIDSSGNVV